MAIKGKKIRREPWQRRKQRVRNGLANAGNRPRLSVFKSVRHTYAQLISDAVGKTLASASTKDAEVIAELQAIKEKLQQQAGAKGDKAKRQPSAASAKSVLAARAVGVVLGRRGLAQDVKQVVFDRNGFVYQGRVRAVAEGARQAGLDF